MIVRGEEEHRRTIVQSVLDGTWSRRLHGTNLEPLRASYRGTDGDDYLKNRADSHADVARAWERVRRMDVQTRFLCQLLDDM